jgi:hypothetical protein
MELVDTETPNPNRFARTPDGAIDFDAYAGLKASYRVESLNVEVMVLEARQRFGHLDLLITPIAGSGERWTEYKNIVLHNDPAIKVPVLAESPAPRVAMDKNAVVHYVPTGTHWTEVAPSQDDATPEEVVESPTTDMEAEVAAILGGSVNSPNIK